MEYQRQCTLNKTNLIRIDQLITTLIFINPTVIQQCYNKENLNHVDKIQIYQLNLTDSSEEETDPEYHEEDSDSN